MDKTPLHLTKEWLNLSFYSAEAGGYKSQIVNNDYFVSERGSADPESELKVFLDGIKTAIKKTSANDWMCRYPARVSFLIERGLIESDDRDSAKCATEDVAVPADGVKGISLVFATGYFGNPSSYYGHVMLQAQARKSSDDPSFSDRAINYGAKIGHSTSNPLYLINGLFGGYEARYNTNSAFIHTHNYLNHQLRDVWVFDLALTSRQSRFVMEHAQELQSARFDYFFFNDNCSHKIAQILEHATGRKLRSSSGFWFSPFQLVNNLKNQGLTKSETWQASRKTRVDQSFSDLEVNEKKQFANFVLSDVKEQKSKISSLSPPVQMIALDYLDMENSISNGDETEALAKIQQSRQIILQNIYRHRAEANYKEAAKYQERERISPFSLFDNPPLSRLATKYAWGEDMERMEVSFRPARNDMLDRFVGYTPPSDFSMLQVALSADHQGVDLFQFDVIEITTLPVSNLPLKLNSEYAWSLYAGYRPFDNTCHRCSIAQIGYSAGWSTKVGDTIIWGMAGGRLMNQYQKNGHLGLSLTSGLVRELPFNNSMLAKYEAEYLTRNGELNQRWVLKATHRLQGDVRVGLELAHNGDDLVGKIGMAIYFY